MPALIGLLLLLGVGFLGGNSFPFGGKLIPPKGPSGYAGSVCLKESALDRNNIILSNIPKPDQTNLPFPDRGPCSGGGCDGPSSADYILAAQNVKVERLWPNPPTTRLYKQKLPDNPQYDSIRDRIYRPSCNDWCLLGLPYGGTFHCDFIFLLKNGQEMIEREPLPGQKELYPKDGSLFDVLIRAKAEIPEKIKCNSTSSGGASRMHKGQSFLRTVLKQVLAQSESFIDFAGHRWIFAQELTLIKYDLRTKAQGREKLSGKVNFRGKEYEAYKNLTNKINLTDNFLYLVKPGVIEAAEKQTNPYYKFNYLEFRQSPEKRPFARTLQLGTFQVPTTKGWWRKWVDESKPAIYLYPPKPTLLKVKLKPAGVLTRSAPAYDPQTGWEVTAYPDGTLKVQTRPAGRQIQSYPYLFYEAKLEKVWVEPSGFIVKGAELVDFFQKELPRWGLNKKETADFISYWMGRLNKNQPYYFIHFLDREQIESLEPLEIFRITNNKEQRANNRQKPDTSIRLRIYFKSLSSKNKISKIAPQKPPHLPKRRGFTLVEWGGILDE